MYVCVVIGCVFMGVFDVIGWGDGIVWLISYVGFWKVWVYSYWKLVFRKVLILCKIFILIWELLWCDFVKRILL